MLDHISVVLVGPMFGGNVGAAARAVKNTGLRDLRLVAPTYEDENEARKFCHGAEDVYDNAPRFPRLVDCIGEYPKVVGFTARGRHRRRYRALRDFADEWVQESLETPVPTALLFGRERDGLTNAELDLCSDLVWIPSSPEHPSYNLAQAVLLAGYELYVARMTHDPSMPRRGPRRTKSPKPAKLASAEEMDALQQHLRSAFLSIGYAYDHTVEPMLRSYTEIFARARLLGREARMIRGLAHQILWAARQIRDRDQSNQ